MRTTKTPAEIQAERDAQLAKSCATIVAALVFLPLQGWLVMLVLGAAHGVYAGVPAIGFGTSILGVLGVNILTAYVRRLFRR